MDEIPTLPAFLTGGAKQLLIGGNWVPALSGRSFTTINPTTGKVLMQVANAGAADIDRAVSAARTALQDPWGKMKPADRQLCLLRLADLVDSRFQEFALIETLDMGSPIMGASLKRQRAVSLLRYYAGLATSICGSTIENSQPGFYISHTVKEPVGVVGAIIPWNGPLSISIWKIAPALAAGCTIVLKPAEQAPLSPLLLGELCLEAGIPPGVVNVVTGDGDAGAALAAHLGVDKVTFTGSTEVGRKIIQASAANLKRVSLELGGKSPDIVFADADLDLAVPGVAMAAFANSGQICSAGTRLLVERKIHDELVERVSAFARALRVGDPSLPQTQIGPLVSIEQLERVTNYLEVGIAEGARAMTGARRKLDADLQAGYFVEPTVFGEVQDGMRIAREEIFGPVISAMPFDSIEEAISRGNDTPYGLASGVWTRDISRAAQVSRGLLAGTVWVNCYQQMDPAVPFGGYKMSGWGRESGAEHMDEYLNTKAIWYRIT